VLAGPRELLPHRGQQAASQKNRRHRGERPELLAQAPGQGDGRTPGHDGEEARQGGAVELTNASCHVADNTTDQPETNR